MRGLDETDRTILDLLLSDGRRPFSDIADAVDLSGPAVSDRIDRLREMGVIQRFTIDVDRSILDAGTPVQIRISPDPTAMETVASDLADVSAVDHRYRTADGDLIVVAYLQEIDAWAFLDAHTDRSVIDGVEVSVLTDVDSTVALDDATLDISCVECSNSVTSEGERRRIDGRVYHFCCPNCEAAFVERYDRLQEGV
ncbi:AsnC family transcriptional regulator [Halococcoides cellulosivorans]|uniref:ArsR family transcriptional regulator n=1 Tax=Halococcoides cellulosivorans TaxID=1679096 RepID=A0A2R4X0S2_9EURY|nr:AsnC family transcriptional regulator [Halococcoides cellulosivorans]AWB27375.1 ArsR family transcriptional regulator [Halococcoides cellulosivorans]